MDSESLTSLRAQIDDLDDKLLWLLLKRKSLVEKVGLIMAQNGTPLSHPEQNQAFKMRLRIIALARGINADMVSAIAEEILQDETMHQASVIRRKTKKLPFTIPRIGLTLVQKVGLRLLQLIYNLCFSIAPTSSKV